MNRNLVLKIYCDIYSNNFEAMCCDFDLVTKQKTELINSSLIYKLMEFVLTLEFMDLSQKSKFIEQIFKISGIPEPFKIEDFYTFNELADQVRRGICDSTLEEEVLVVDLQQLIDLKLPKDFKQKALYEVLWAVFSNQALYLKHRDLIMQLIDIIKWTDSDS